MRLWYQVVVVEEVIIVRKLCLMMLHCKYKCAKDVATGTGDHDTDVSVKDGEYNHTSLGICQTIGRNDYSHPPSMECVNSKAP